MTTPSAHATRQQQIASNPAHCAWVSASAGSGKTKVLTDRVLRLLLSGTVPARILCITYTKAAAAEMQNRIHSQLGKWVMLEEEQLLAELQQLIGYAPSAELLRTARQLFAHMLDDVTGMRILTIHAFCQSLLARFPLEAKVPPDFNILDERTALELLETAKMRILETGINEQGIIEKLSTGLGEWGFSEIMRQIFSCRREYQKIMNNPDNALQRIWERLNLPYQISEAELYPVLSEQAAQELFFAAEILLDSGREEDINRGATIKIFLREKVLTDEYYAVFLTKTDTIRSKQLIKALAEKYPRALTALKNESERLYEYKKSLFALHSAQMSENLLILAAAVFTIYNQLKEQHRALDYDDLIQKAHDLLCAENALPWVLFKLDGGIEHILIDEAQDTSPESWEIAAVLAEEFFNGSSAVTKDRTVFVVGDEKQSIFRFQGADPQGFARMREFFSERANNANKKLENVEMEVSFRSTPAVLQLVDSVFQGKVARSGLVGADSLEEKNITHISHRGQALGKVEMWKICAPVAKEKQEWKILSGQENNLKKHSFEQLAENIADCIAGWLKNERILVAKDRPINAGDIMVLVRKRTNFVNQLSQSLKKRGVNVAGLDRMRLTSHIAVMDLLALGQFLLLPEDDLNLACLLKSPIFNLDEDSLFALCYQREESLWQSLRKNNQDIYQQLAEILARADYQTPWEFYTDLLYAHGGMQKFIARMGQEVSEPLAVFLQETLKYQNQHTPSMQGFLHWIQQGEGDVKRDMEQSIGAVRIMTVHASKGLQAPIVFLPDTTSVPDTRCNLFPQDGAILYSPSSDADPTEIANLREQLKKSEMQEYNRLLYVALTRAEDELYICGAIKDKAPHQNCWYNLVKEGFERIGGNVIDFVGENEYIKENIALKHDVIPAWYNHDLPPEPILPLPLSPSNLLDPLPASPSPLEVERGVQRGNLIHRLLHILSEVPADKRAQLAENWLLQNAGNWSALEAKNIATEVLNVMQHPDFAESFGVNSLAEVPITGIIDQQVVSGRIDRMSVMEKQVLAIDFKTGSPAKDGIMPVGYKRQMDCYRHLLEKIYPQKQVKCAILYTSVPILVEL